MEPEQSYSFEAKLWLYPGEKAAWHFITVPLDISHQIRFFAGRTNGFGSVRVRVRARIGGRRRCFPTRPRDRISCRSRRRCARPNTSPPATGSASSLRQAKSG